MLKALESPEIGSFTALADERLALEDASTRWTRRVTQRHAVEEAFRN